MFRAPAPEEHDDGLVCDFVDADEELVTLVDVQVLALTGL